jgi:hypothetical protein
MGNVILTRADILRGLELLNERARHDGIAVDISIYGGAALILAFDLERATRDVDVSITNDIGYVRRVAGEIAEALGWPESWPNDGVKDFLSAHE